MELRTSLPAATSRPWSSTRNVPGRGRGWPRWRADEARYKDEVMARRKSVLDLLEEYPACQLPFNVYLEMLRRSARATTRSRRRRSTTRAAAASRWRWWRARRRVRPRSLRGRVLELTSSARRGSLVSAFVKDTRSAFRLPDDPTTPAHHDRSGTGPGPVPRLPPGARGACARRAGPSAPPCSSSAAATPNRTSSTRGSCVASPREAWRRSIPASRGWPTGRASTCGTRSSSGRTTSGPPGGGRDRLRLRGRYPYGSRRAARLRSHPPREDGRDGGAGGGMARRSRRAEPLSVDVWASG